MGIFNKKSDADVAADTEVKEESVVKENVVAKKSEKAPAKKKNKEVSLNSQAFRILVRPLITEKAAAMGDLSKYVFEVSDDANKIAISKAIFDIYGVKPKDVNVINMLGKVVRRGRLTGKRKDWRKAIVTLPKGKTIDIYEGI